MTIYARLFVLLALIFGPAPITLLAQVQATNGSIQGEVLDAAGAEIPDAAVEADEVDTHTVHTTTTSGTGHFDFLSLQPGRYVVKISKTGFATTIQQNLNLTVGTTASLHLTLQAGTTESIIVTSAPLVDVVTASSTSTLGEQTIATTPVLGRKFEDLLTLTPGVSISQGPDGDEININGQRGIFNNISLDGGDYNNGFFGEQSGGQRAAVDITLEAVKEFQVVASGANAEFGRTAGGVVNVITKSGTNDFRGSLFEYQRLESLASNTSDGNPLTDFHREQFGGSVGGHIIKDKLFYFGAAEGINENLSRPNLSTYNKATLGGAAPCAVTNPTFGSNITDAQINANGDCQRQALVNFYKTNFKEDEGQPVDHVVHNGAFFGRIDYTINQKNALNASYNFDYSNNPNQTFDVATYGTSANGVEGPSHVHTLNFNLTTTLNSHQLNEAHFTYGYETRPRSPINPNAVPDTGIGFAPSFRFGQPFFLGPGSCETFYHIDAKDNFSWIIGKHAIKVGVEDLYSHNEQVFDGFALGRYIFGSVTGFLHYATPASAGNGYGPTTVSCADGSFQSAATSCPGGSANSFGSPLFLYIQDAATQPNETVQQAGYSNISNQEPAVYAQDTWQIASRLTINYGLRWEAQFFPKPVIAPANTAYGPNLSDPRFPSTGYLPDQTKEFQPRVGFNYDVFGNGKSALRGSAGIFNARQNGLTQVGAITTNGAQQQTINTCADGSPVYPNPCPVPTTYSPIGAGVTVFDKNYHNPRIYTFNVGYDQQVFQDYVAFIDFTNSKGVFLTRFLNPNVGPTVIPAVNADTVSYVGDPPFPNLGAITNTISNSKSLYRGLTIGVRKRMSHHFQFEAEYTYSNDRDDDSNERDPFTFRYANLYNLAGEYSLSDRDEPHKFNAFGLGDLPFGFKGNLRIQQHSAQPETDNTNGTGTGAPCSFDNSLTRFVDGIDCGRNHLRKDNAFFVLDFGIARPIHFHDGKYELIPRAEVFNTLNNTNNINPLSSPALFDFSGFLRAGVGDPRQAQLSLRFAF